MRKAKKVARKKTTKDPALPGKLADCASQDLSMTELFLVEDDSAGSSAKQARDCAYQAIMPLRGKILNSWEVDSSEVLASQEIHDISVVLGVDPASDNLDGLRYGKICILADADLISGKKFPILRTKQKKMEFLHASRLRRRKAKSTYRVSRGWVR